MSGQLDNMSSIEGDMLSTETTLDHGDLKTNGDSTRESDISVKPPPTTTNSSSEPVKTQVIIIGGGFSGITAMHRLRLQGLSYKTFEQAPELGGTWYWNRYPGARVDSEAPFYQLNIPEVYKDFNFKERFSDHVELRRYMRHIDSVLGLSKDVYFNERVVSSSWNAETNEWTVKSESGKVVTGKYLICASGGLHRKYTPDFEGLEDFKGQVIHSGAWPEDASMKGKKVGLIGAGATAVQITQEVGKVAESLTVFLRRPSYCLPMVQRDWGSKNESWKTYYTSLFKEGRNSGSGFPGEAPKRSIHDVPEEERERYFNDLWTRGGFNYLLGQYPDVVADPKANMIAYDFWRRKVLARLTDPKKSAIMAPEKPPYYIMTKRTPLEQDYYEILNQPNVELVDLNATPLKTFTEKGMLMSDGKLHEMDVLVLATGFDSITGSLTNMGLKSKDGVDLKDLWKDGVFTYLGLTVAGFPNMFMAFSPQSPIPLSNGTTIIECQIETIMSMIEKLEKENAKTIEATHESEVKWKELCAEMAKPSLFPFTSSWWDGGNIPGKKAEGMMYVGGVQLYESQCRETLDGWKGFQVVPAV